MKLPHPLSPPKESCEWRSIACDLELEHILNEIAEETDIL